MKNKLLSPLLRMGLAVTAIFLLFAAQPAYAVSDVSISALDTIANFGTQIKADSLLPNEAISFSVKKPDGSLVKMQTIASQEGNASVTFEDNQTLLAGAYSVILDNYNEMASFEVFPGEMNPETSGLYSSKGFVGANGADFAKVNVRIVDDFGNPLEFHEVKLTSSRGSDRIVAQLPETDENGLAAFLISSKETGVATFIATDESTGLTLSTRLKITFFKAPTVFKSVGGDPETILLAQASQTVSKFVIDNIPASVYQNETVSFQLKAIDALGYIVPAYTGTVIFSSTDTNAKYPNPYTFQPSDQGKKTFDLGLSFATLGTQKLTVQQEANALIKGEKTMEVMKKGSSGAGSSVIITKPATGTYAVNMLEIAGETSPSAKVKIFDNGQQIAEVVTDGNGRFSFKTSLLKDGQHAFHAESNGIQSTATVVTIDSTPAQIEQVNISKTNLTPGQTTEITFYSDPDLNSVQATVGDLIIDLESDPKNPGFYQGTLTAPLQTGEYTVNVILTDKLGNVTPTTEVGKLVVGSFFPSGSQSVFNVPSKVGGVQASPGNGKVTLTWQQAQTGIAFYRIYYGTNPDNLNLVVNTLDSKTQWDIPSLQNGTAYYFQVSAVDTANNESDNRSNMVSATPSASLQTSQSPVLCDPMPCPPDFTYPPTTPEDGPEVFGIIIASLLGGSLWRVYRKRYNIA